MRCTVIVNYNTRMRVKRFFHLFAAFSPHPAKDRKPVVAACTNRRISIHETSDLPACRRAKSLVGARNFSSDRTAKAW